MRYTTRKLMLATCFAAVPALAIAQAPAQQPPQTPAQQQQMNRDAQPQQTQTTTQRATQTSSGTFLSAPQAGQVRAADLRDADIYTADNQKVGDIQDILLDRQGRIVAVVVGVGGFLGIGQKDVAIPFDRLEMQDPNMAAASDARAPARTGAATSTTTTERTTERTTDRMATGAVPGATDPERQRTTAQRAEDVSNQQANRQAAPGGAASTTTTTTTQTPAQQRTAQATGGLWKVERILLKGVTKAELEQAPEFRWDANAANRAGSNPNSAPARNR